MEAEILELNAWRRELITSDANGISKGSEGYKGAVLSQSPLHIDPIITEERSKVTEFSGGILTSNSSLSHLY